MKKSQKQIGFYRGFKIVEKTEITEQVDNEMLDWLKATYTVGREKTYYQIVVKDAYLTAQSIDDAKKYIDRIIAKEEDIFDDGLDRVDDSPGRFFNDSYCVNQDVTCDNCSYVNYNRDCKNNKVLSC